MQIHRIRTHAEYRAHWIRNAKARAQQESFIAANTDARTCQGYSYPAGEMVDFLLARKQGQAMNWRESVVCPKTGLNNRMRAAVHLFDTEMCAYPDSAIYVTEQVTAFFKAMEARYANIIGSEFLGSSIPRGQLNPNGVRNEDLCALSFATNAFDCIISLDVLEHIPDFAQSVAECYRCLKPDGRLMWSAPFNPLSTTNTIRATINGDGTINHLLPAQYHGDPMSKDGVLCFTVFGWELLEQMRAVGFKDVYGIPCQSAQFGYIGPEAMLFFAVK